MYIHRGINTHVYIISTHLEIWLTCWSHLHTRVQTLTAAAYTFTSAIADTLAQTKTQSGTGWQVSWHENLIYKLKLLALLTPLLSRQVRLLLGHSQALPSQPCVHAHRPITQEPRSVETRKKKVELFYVGKAVEAEITNSIQKRKITQRQHELYL